MLMLVIGLFVGFILGVFTLSLCVAAAKGDEAWERARREMEAIDGSDNS